MLKRLRERAAEAPGSVLWLAPTGRAVEALRGRLLNEASIPGRPRLHTFHEMLQEIVRANDPAARLLSGVQRRLLTEDLVAGLAADGRLAHFAGVADTHGFTDGVLGLLADLQRNAVPVERFEEATASAGPKERQCAHLYAQYQGELRRQHLHDADGVAARAGDLLREGLRQPFAEVRAMFVDGFGDFTRPQHDILELLSEWVEELWIVLPDEESGQRADLFARPRATMERLRKLRPEVEWLTSADVDRPAGLTHLERQIFNPIRTLQRAEDSTGVSRIEAPGVLGEVRLVVRRIKKLLRDGVGADDVLVVLRDVSPYADILTEVFDEYAVPVEVDGTEQLTRNPAISVLLRALRLPDDDWPFAGVTALLRNTYFRPLWPEATDRSDMAQRAEMLLRLLGEPRGRHAYLTAITAWAEKQEPGLEDEQAEESLRRRKHELAKECAPFLQRFFQVWEAAPAKAPLAEHLAWLRLFAHDVGVTREAEEDDRDAAALDQLWREVGHWLEREERRHGPGGRTLDRKTFLRRLTALAAESSLPRSPAGPGRVRVLSANQARHLEADYVFILGLGERSFPRLTPPLSLFDDQERQILQSADIDFGAGDLLPEEMLLFYQVASRARRELILSYPAVDQRGQELLPSSFLLAVRACLHPDAFKGKVEQRRMLIQGIDDEPLSAAEIRVRAAKNYKAGGLDDPALPTDLRANLQDAGKLFENRFESKYHNAYDGLLRNPAVVGELTSIFGPERIFSPTALEEYISCPFKFFLHHVLHLEPLEEPSEEIEVTRRGQAYHRAMARLHRKLKASGVHGPTDAVTQDVTREMTEAVEEDVRRAPSPAAKELWRLEGRRLVRTAERYVAQWRKFLKPWLERGVSPQPDLFEADFGLPTADGSPPVGPLVVRIDDVEVRVSGRIDRVDLVELDDGVGFWIIDYKTGRSGHYTGKALSEYSRLQLTLYALAVEEVLLAGRAARPLGLAYWLEGEGGPKVALPGRAAAQWLDDGSRWRTIREDLRQWVAVLVRNIRQGNFVLQPREENCTQTCSFGQTCRITQARGVGKEGMLSLPLAGDEA
jgi:ATP-dependent helicase/nuclease subunit B